MAFVCGECARKGRAERDSPGGFLISMAVGADSLRESPGGEEIEPGGGSYKMKRPRDLDLSLIIRN